MNISWTRRLAFCAALVLSACGGGSEGVGDTGPDELLAASVKPPAASLVSVDLQSQPGDFIGAGLTYRYTKADSVITVDYASGLIRVSVAGDQNWTGEFKIPGSQDRLKNGTYSGLTRYPFAPAGEGAMNWSGQGRGCNTLTGSFTVSSVVYAKGNGLLESFNLSFEQHCEGASPALFGQIQYTTKDATVPPGPVNPVPANLWAPSAGAVPTGGRYIYLESDPGDFIAQGQTYLHTGANSTLSATVQNGLFSVSVTGDKSWTGQFKAMDSLPQLQPGYYGDLQRYPFHNTVKGGMNWSGDGRGCNVLNGWFAVDSVSYRTDGALAAIKLRFEQHCEGVTAALRGQINWVAEDTTQPPGPVNPPPEGLWTPAAGATPTSGRYVYLQSDAGDYIGQGQSYLYTSANAALSTSTSDGLLNVSANGDKSWSGQFKAMNGLTQLQPGYYGDLLRYPFHNPAKGGLNWSGDGRGCNTLKGWFVVDEVSYANGALASIKLRFEQHCEGAAPALRGQINWVADEVATPGGPTTPPADLWAPAAGTTPATGPYVYLKSDVGDYIGQGRSYLYTSFTPSSSNGLFSVRVSSLENWTGDFKAMSQLTQLQPGYYGDLQRYPFHNTAKGGLSWTGEGRGCNTLSGWFVVDSVTYVSGTLTAIKLRFEQHCEGGAPALRGEINWAAP